MSQVARVRIQRTVLGALAAATLAIATAAGNGRAERAAANAAAPALIVQVFGGNFASDERELDVTLDFTGATRAPARISLFAPTRFQLYPRRQPGDPVGKAFLYLRNRSSASSPFTLYSGQIAAEQVDTTSEAAAQTCSPGDHIGIWLLHLAHSRRTVDLRIYLATPSSDDPPGAGLKLELCSFSEPKIASSPIAAIVLSLAYIGAPSTPDTYRWRALVSPLGVNHTTPLVSASYELRALVPVPHRLTLDGEYRPSTHQAVVHGVLRTRGRPVSRAVIYLTRLDRTITPHGPTFHDAAAAITLTTRAGAYALAVPLHTTRGFLASTPPTTARCTGPAFAPAGCRTTTTAGIESDPITISVP